MVTSQYKTFHFCVIVYNNNYYDIIIMIEESGHRKYLWLEKVVRKLGNEIRVSDRFYMYIWDDETLNSSDLHRLTGDSAMNTLLFDLIFLVLLHSSNGLSK